MASYNDLESAMAEVFGNKWAQPAFYGDAPQPTYACLVPLDGATTFASDRAHVVEVRYAIEVYARYRDRDTEQALHVALAARGIGYELDYDLSPEDQLLRATFTTSPVTEFTGESD